MVEPESGRATNSSLTLGLLLILAIGSAGLAFILYPSIWLVEQFALAGGQTTGRGMWVAAVAGHALATLLPALLGLALTADPRIKAAFRLLALAGGFALLSIPVQLVAPAAAQTAALVQMGVAAVYLLGLAMLRRRAGRPLTRPTGPYWPAFLAAALVVWPWVAWGALGSWLDSVLNLAAAILFGLAVGQTLEFTLLAGVAKESGRPLGFGVGGLVVGVALLTMGAAFGASGQQLIFLFLLSGLGWLSLAVAQWGRGVVRAGGWLAAAFLVGLVVAAPQLLIDPEELALVLNLMTRDVGFYAFRAVVIGLFTGLLLGAVLWPLARRATTGRNPLPALLALAAWGGLVALYLLIGQTGWHGERLYVIFTQQPDLTAAAATADPQERRAAVYDTLVSYAGIAQADVRRALDTVGIDYTAYYLVNALEVDGGPLLRRWLEARPEVDRVLSSPALRPLPAPPPTAQGTANPPTEPQWNLTQIGAPRVWEEFGARGAGIVIGQSDSGVDGAHPELSAQYRGNQTGGPAGDDYNWFDPWYATAAPADRGGHGTHTLGSALGRSVGVAPDATWIGCVNLARNLGNAPRYLDCMQFLLAPFPQGGDPWRDGRPELGAHVLNNSWGCPEIEGCDATALLPAVRALRAAGVFVVASAGNEGSACGSVAAPISLYDEVFSVGAVDEAGYMAPFSSRGPVTADGSGRVKPDVVAPGVAVLSAFPGGTYEYSDGTSMAGPHVVGVVALLWSAEPSLIGDVARTEEILTMTAAIPENGLVDVVCGDPETLPNNTFGYGLVDAYAAVARTLAEDGG